jgi:hypothetical protein
MLYLPPSNSPGYCSNCSEDGGFWYCSGGSTSTHDRNSNIWSTHAHTCKQGQKIRNNTTLHQTVHKTMIKLFYALQRSREHKNQLKRS